MNKKIKYFIFVIFIGLSAGAVIGQIIPRENPPNPILTETSTSIGDQIITNYIYSCTYQTNANDVITEYRTINITNIVQVNKYPKMIGIQPMFRTNLTCGTDWVPVGELIWYKPTGLATNDTGFYSAKVVIE